MLEHLNKRWFYLRDDKDFPVACVASELDEYPNGEKINFALAIHNPLDNYDRLRARNTALERLSKKRPVSRENMSDMEFAQAKAVHEVKTIARFGAKEGVLKYLSADGNLPQRVRDAAWYRLKLFNHSVYDDVVMLMNGEKLFGDVRSVTPKFVTLQGKKPIRRSQVSSVHFCLKPKLVKKRVRDGN